MSPYYLPGLKTHQSGWSPLARSRVLCFQNLGRWISQGQNALPAGSGWWQADMVSQDSFHTATWGEIPNCLVVTHTLVPHISIGLFDTQTQHKQKLNQMTALHTHTRIIKQQICVWRQDLFFSPWIRDDFWLTKLLFPLGNYSCPNRSVYLCKITKLRLSSKVNSSLKANIPSY